jgi:hypothetical protein
MFCPFVLGHQLRWLQGPDLRGGRGLITEPPVSIWFRARVPLPSMNGNWVGMEVGIFWEYGSRTRFRPRAGIESHRVIVTWDCHRYGAPT